LRLSGGSMNRVPTPSNVLDHIAAITANGALTEDGTVWYWGADGEPVKTAMTNVIEIAATGDEVCGLRRDGTVACAGPATRCAAAAPKPPAVKPAAKPAAGKKPAKAPAKRAPAKKTPAKKAPAKKAVVQKAAKKAAPPSKKPVAAKKAPVKKTPPAKAAQKARPRPQAAPPKKAAPARRAAAPKVPADKFLAEQQALLLQERAMYVEQADSLKAEADQLAQEMEPGDIQFDEESGEGGTMAVDRERDLALSAQARAAVEEIDHALTRIARGTYGQCERCGQPIPKARLKALPFARLCVACKSGGLSRR
jgi:DnaK suppressor protein